MIVWNTIANMRALDASISSFFRALESKIATQNGWRFLESEEIYCPKTSNGWCYYASYWRYSLRRVPRGTNRNRGPGNLTVGVELWRDVVDDRNAWPYAKHPLIYVGFSPYQNDDYCWADDMACDHLGTTPAYPNDEIVPPTENAPYLWTWSGEKGRWSLRNWFFVLSMFAISDREDIQREIVGPLYSLLVENGNPAEIFQETQVIQTGPVL